MEIHGTVPTMTLGGVALDTDLFWSDENQWTSRVGSEERTLDGSMVTQSYHLQMGRPITLVGEADSGWQSRATVEALKALAEVDQVYDLVMYGVTRKVRFRYSEAPVSFDPISRFIPTSGATEWWFVGTINLVEVQ